MKWLAALAVVAACGDHAPASGTFTIVGHADLGARGMNSALAVIGDTAYVGSRIDNQPILIVDIKDPKAPAVVGEIPGTNGISSRELRAVPDRDLLIVLNLACATDLHGCQAGQGEPENLKLYDIADHRAPALLATYPVTGGALRQRSPHEFFVDGDLVYLAATPAAPDIEVLDISGRTFAPVKAWDTVRDGKLPTGNPMHSVGVSRDGTTLFASHSPGVLAIVDLATWTITNLASTPNLGTHSAVPALGRPLLVVTDEVYPMPYGAGCPWGHLRTVDLADPAQPAVVGEFALPENEPSFCATAPTNTAFTAHNATVTHDLALVSWYAGGLQAIDISDPAHPAQLAELRPDPLASVTKEDPALGGSPVEMWSYPVIQEGLIYIVDVRNGLYVVRYDGRWGEQLRTQRFLEGNSNRDH